MSGSISAGGLITGIASADIIKQLMQLERQPVLRAQSRITGLRSQQEAVKGLRSQLQTLRNRLQDFRLTNIFRSFNATSSETSVLNAEISANNPVSGAFEVNVTRLASATTAQSSAAIGAAIDPSLALNSSGITAASITSGTFTINGVQFNVDGDTDSLDDLIQQINTSNAGVTASYDAAQDKMVIANTAPNDANQIVFGASGDTSNVLSALTLTQATQFTNNDGSTEVRSTRHLGAVDPTKELNTLSFAGGAVSAGAFSINGISITVDPAQDSILDIIERINASDAQVTASFDTASDSIRFVSKNLGSRTIRFGGASDTSNFLDVTNLANATQAAGNDALFSINGGATQTRNTNDVSDAIGGVTLRLLSTGVSTVRVANDDDKIVEDVRAFVTAFNASVNQIRNLTSRGAALGGDSGIRAIEEFLRQNIFAQVGGLNGEFDSLLSIGLNTGKDFDSQAVQQLQFDEERFRAALLENRGNVEQLFSNAAGTGITDRLYTYLDQITSTTGFLNNRAKEGGAISNQISSLNDQIGRLEDRLLQKEDRLRRQFNRMETLSSNLQQQNSALANLGRGLRLF